MTEQIELTRRQQRAEAFRRSEHLRALAFGPLAHCLGGGGLLLLIAIEYFDAALWQRSVLASLLNSGLLLGPLLITLTARKAIPPHKVMAICYLWLGCGLVAAACAHSALALMWAVVPTLPLMQAVSPLITATWSHQVDPGLRGRWFGRLVVITAISGLAANMLASWWLDHGARLLGPEWPAHFRWPLIVLAGCAWLTARAAWKQPPCRLTAGGRNPFACLRHLWRHPLFGYCSAAWMLIGFGNLATLPLRIDWLADDNHGLGYSPGLVIILTVIIPAFCAMIAGPIWGRLYDNINFIWLRIWINACFLLSIVCFFEDGLGWQISGAILFGIGLGGGNVAWNLWVLRFAPNALVAEYQACHTFLTGLRGIAGPPIAYAVISDLSIRHATWIGAAIVMISILMFAAVIPKGRVSMIAES